jgi:bacterial/archaeal transporter family-2 protein
MPTSVVATFAIAAGFCVALQAAANGKFRQNLDSPLYAAFFSICGTILTATLAIAVMRPPAPAMAAVRETAWWNWIGGPLGAIIVLAGAALAPRLGVAAFMTLVIAGQLLCSLILDHYALMGLPENPLTWQRVLGAAFIVAGVVCVKFL